jgi:drug/metabolite transporter (DMT)-like permease
MTIHEHTTIRKSSELPKGILYVVLGASSYGMLSTFVKLSYKQGFSPAEVTSAQYLIGVFCLLLINLFANRTAIKPARKDIVALMLCGTCVGLTSVLYYISVKFINASIAVVILMQSVWMGVVVEIFQTRKPPNFNKIIAIVLILVGTFFATDLAHASRTSLDIRGLIFGFLAAVSFSVVLYSTNSVATHLASVQRSFYMLIGGTSVVLIFGVLTQIAPQYLGLSIVDAAFTTNKAFDFSVFYKWGLLVGIFGTVIPPIMLNNGFPITGVGLGSILSSAELPVAIIVAFFLLGETVNASQWLGVFLILSAIVLMNYAPISAKRQN